MNLDALLNDDPPIGALKPCKIGRMAGTLEEPHRSAFLRIVNREFKDGGLPPVVAAAKIASAGLKVSETTISKHRRGLCGCESVVTA